MVAKDIHTYILWMLPSNAPKTYDILNLHVNKHASRHTADVSVDMSWSAMTLSLYVHAECRCVKGMGAVGGRSPVLQSCLIGTRLH